MRRVIKRACYKCRGEHKHDVRVEYGEKESCATLKCRNCGAETPIPVANYHALLEATNAKTD